MKYIYILQESEDSQEVTPRNSVSQMSDTETDSDSDIDITPRREVLVTPPTGFAASPIPDIVESNLSVSNMTPPPLPVSPPPSLLCTGRDDEDSDNNSVSDVEVEVGVAELMDSCRSEMVLLHNSAEKPLEGEFNTSLIVREDSALTFNSRDASPVLNTDNSRTVTPADNSREATPCVDVGGDVTPVYDDVSQEQSELDRTAGTNLESVIDSIYSGDATLESVASGAQTLETDSGSESDTSAALCRTGEPTSDNVDLGTGSFQTDAEQHLETAGTSVLDTGTLSNNGSNLAETTDSENSETCVNIGERKGDRSISHESDQKENNSEDQKSDRSEEDDLDDDDIRQLEKKYFDLEQNDEESDEFNDLVDSDNLESINLNLFEYRENKPDEIVYNSDSETTTKDDLGQTTCAENLYEFKDNTVQKVLEESELSSSEEEGEVDDSENGDKDDIYAKEGEDLRDGKESEESDESEEEQEPSLLPEQSLQPGVSALCSWLE